jgi:hypothetical protein
LSRTQRELAEFAELEATERTPGNRLPAGAATYSKGRQGGAMVTRETPHSELARLIGEASDAIARVIAQRVQELVRQEGYEYIVSAEGLGFLAMCLEDYTTDAVVVGGKIAAIDPGIRKSIARAAQRAAGTKSGAVRAATSRKAKFLSWVKVKRQTHPRLSKNELASLYARDHDGVSVATLRRYLSGWTEVFTPR